MQSHLARIARGTFQAGPSNDGGIHQAGINTQESFGMQHKIKGSFLIILAAIMLLTMTTVSRE